MSKKIVHFILLVIFSIVFYKSILYTPIFPGKISRIVLSLIQYISIVFCGVIIYQHNGKNIVIFLFEIYGSYLVISYIKFADRFYVSVVTLILFFQWRIYKYYDKLEWCMEKERKQKKLEKVQKVERRWDVALLLLVLIALIIHEMFHASEHKYLVLYEKEIVPYSKAAEEKYLIYKSELGKDLSDEEYINAITEQDANIYAEQETNIFMKKIEKYEEEKNK